MSMLNWCFCAREGDNKPLKTKKISLNKFGPIIFIPFSVFRARPRAVLNACALRIINCTVANIFSNSPNIMEKPPFILWKK